MVAIRRAMPSDASAMGQIHIRAWRAAYRGQMPDSYLDGLSERDRTRMWSEILGEEDESRLVLVVEEERQVVGFGAMGPASDPPGAGELYSINVDPDHWGRGCGRQLLDAAERGLAERGFEQAVLWVLPGNARALGFYRSAGWGPDGAERTTDVLGVEVFEIRYRRDLNPPGRSIH
jgi:ribosomal protein S18 acetylase RimI-like enzyme